MRIILLFVIALACGPLPAVAAQRIDACTHLKGLFPVLARGPLFLASFPTVEDGPLYGSAFLYDNAVATLALVGCGETALAQRIGDALLIAIDNDRFWHDGRLRNGYAAGSVKKKAPIKLPGWWDEAQQRWLEDRYQVGSDTGNMAWAMLALLALDKATGDAAYRTGAMRIGTWVTAQRDNRGVAGFAGGTFAHEPEPERIYWKSTEHNTDLAAAFAWLARLDQPAAPISVASAASATKQAGTKSIAEDRAASKRWREPADISARFVQAMWDPKRNCFATGTGDDGVTINPIIVLDAQVWPLLALPGATQQFAPALGCAREYLSHEGGYAYSEVRDGVWTEGSAQMLLLLELLKRDPEAQQLRKVIDRQRTPDGSYYASSAQHLPTGFMLATDPLQPRLYYRLPHLGAVAWVALAERKYNPFTGEFALPVR